MTREEKFGIIKARYGLDDEWSPYHLSIMIIGEYLNVLKKHKLVESPFDSTDMGSKLISTCKEFEWVPLDSEIAQFVITFSPEEQREPMLALLLKYRDDPTEFVKNIERVKNYGIK